MMEALKKHPNRYPILILLALQLFSFYCMHGFSWRNGYYTALADASKPDSKYLPGTSTPLVHSYSGVDFIDRILTTAQCLYANFTDGNSPQASLFNFHFAGQGVSIMMVFMIEAYRVGNMGTFLRLSLLPWLAFIGIGYGAMMGIYGALHLLISKTAVKSPLHQLAMQVRTRDTNHLQAIPWSLLLGYIVPTILMGLPIFSSQTHQYFTAIWHQSPFLVTGFQTLLATFLTHPKPPPFTNHSPDRLSTSELSNLYYPWVLAFTISACSHLTTGIIFVFRTRFPRLHLAELSFADIFVPRAFWNLDPLPDMATGALTLFQYDFYGGCILAITWATFLLRIAYGGSFSPSRWFWLAAEILVVSVMVGPAGALVSIMWHRDELVISDALQVEAKKDGERLSKRRSNSDGGKLFARAGAQESTAALIDS